jgi:pentatricopeptide repeat protein
VEWAIELLTEQCEDSALNIGSEACEKVLVACCQHSMLDRAMKVYDFMRNSCHTRPSPQGYMLLLRLIWQSASSRNMAPAFRIWEDLQELYDGSPPDWVYHAMMLPLSKHLKM